MFQFHRELSPLGPLDTQAFTDTHTHTHTNTNTYTQEHNVLLYLVCLLILFDQDGQVFPQGPYDVCRTLVGFTKQRHDGHTLAL